MSLACVVSFDSQECAEGGGDWIGRRGRKGEGGRNQTRFRHQIKEASGGSERGARTEGEKRRKRIKQPKWVVLLLYPVPTSHRFNFLIDVSDQNYPTHSHPSPIPFAPRKKRGFFCLSAPVPLSHDTEG